MIEVNSSSSLLTMACAWPGRKARGREASPQEQTGHPDPGTPARPQQTAARPDRHATGTGRERRQRGGGEGKETQSLTKVREEPVRAGLLAPSRQKPAKPGEQQLCRLPTDWVGGGGGWTWPMVPIVLSWSLLPYRGPYWPFAGPICALFELQHSATSEPPPGAAGAALPC